MKSCKKTLLSQTRGENRKSITCNFTVERTGRGGGVAMCKSRDREQRQEREKGSKKGGVASVRVPIPGDVEAVATQGPGGDAG